MKESIEYKLGMSIETYFENFRKKLRNAKYETEERNPLDVLTVEELDFLAAYVKENELDKKIA